MNEQAVDGQAVKFGVSCYVTCLDKKPISMEYESNNIEWLYLIAMITFDLRIEKDSLHKFSMYRRVNKFISRRNTKHVIISNKLLSVYYYNNISLVVARKAQGIQIAL